MLRQTLPVLRGSLRSVCSLYGHGSCVPCVAMGCQTGSGLRAREHSSESNEGCEVVLLFLTPYATLQHTKRKLWETSGSCTNGKWGRLQHFWEKHVVFPRQFVTAGSVATELGLWRSCACLSDPLIGLACSRFDPNDIFFQQALGASSLRRTTSA